jgi:hypothetical protein
MEMLSAHAAEASESRMSPRESNQRISRAREAVEKGENEE